MRKYTKMNGIAMYLTKNEKNLFSVNLFSLKSFFKGNFVKAKTGVINESDKIAQSQYIFPETASLRSKRNKVTVIQMAHSTKSTHQSIVAIRKTMLKR